MPTRVQRTVTRTVVLVLSPRTRTLYVALVGASFLNMSVPQSAHCLPTSGATLRTSATTMPDVLSIVLIGTFCEAKSSMTASQVLLKDAFTTVTSLRGTGGAGACTLPQPTMASVSRAVVLMGLLLDRGVGQNMGVAYFPC